MDKLKQQTPDLTQINIDKIAALFPNCITEKRDADGNLTRAINFDLLKQMLSPEVLAGDEAYEFTWVGKKASIVEANKPIRKTLRPCKEESKGWDTTENLYIEGDNLDVLKLLQESYLGKVKMIYIDPPYNTGHDFIYKDDFSLSRGEWSVESGELGDEDNRLFRNTDANGRFHSDWCSMIYARLVLARNLLKDDGAVFVSIDDKEIANLRSLMDEVFGNSNLIGVFVWEGNGKNDSRYVSEAHEYIVVYAKSLLFLKESNLYWRANKNGVNEIHEKANEILTACNGDYNEATQKLREWYKSLDKNNPSWKHKHYSNIDERGVYFAGDISAESGRGREPYTILHPKTRLPCKLPARGLPTKPTMDEWIRDGYIDFGENELCVPKRKRYLSETDKYVVSSIIYKDSRAAFKELVKMFGAEIFDNPKDISVIQLLIEIVSSKDSIIMDFFSGSATTAHAVMQLNAEDGGHRKFIMVQLPEKCDEKSEAYKAGYKNICEIGKERIRRAGDKIKAEAGLMAQDLDIGFRVFKLDDTNMKDVYYGAAEYTQSLLDDMTSNIKEDRTDMDLLYGCLLEWGLPLSLPQNTEQIEGCTVHTVNDGDLIACFDRDIPENVIREIAKRKPLRVVFRDSSFSSSPAKINVEEIFKLIAPGTSVKVI